MSIVHSEARSPQTDSSAESENGCFRTATLHIPPTYIQAYFLGLVVTQIRTKFSRNPAIYRRSKHHTTQHEHKMTNPAYKRRSPDDEIYNMAMNRQLSRKSSATHVSPKFYLGVGICVIITILFISWL
ncbi:hypothetical protein PROFUN_08304 [Planoprotostelium fungivorum]|uniref:Uncharacterized protein n=1 Tax=Planoprotostelium fungivorum TaxID=1890364 RepID=A0A2P6NK11_9EUKA|nr:hypothetical protein PROFUN_08304 [Planoprotostelium fungivorum]